MVAAEASTMATHILDTDYLVVGAGAAGMAFTDALTADADVDVIVIDRRHAPGGHWNDAYPFVRLHQPSSYYGVNSLPLGADTIDTDGLNAGMYERASGPEICGYYDRVMHSRLVPSDTTRCANTTATTASSRS
jgi:cation diffusion facilitator CzcD-associated flavoprotein CzcO